MSQRLTALTGLVCLVLAGSASAETLKLSFKHWTTYDSNVYNVSGDPEGDYIFRIAPSFELDRSHGHLNYNLRGEVRHERFLHLNGQSAWDYSLFARANYRLTGRTTIYASNTFFLTHSLSRRSIIDDSGGSALNEVEFGRPRVKSNALTIGANHNFAGGWSANSSFTWSMYETNRNTDFQSQTLAATASANYVVSGSDRLGFGLSARTTDFEQDGGFQSNSGSQTFNVFGTWFHAFGSRSSLFVRAGPSWIDQESQGTVTSRTGQLIPAVNVNGTIASLIPSSCQTENGFPVTQECTGFMGWSNGSAEQQYLTSSANNTVLNLLNSSGGFGNTLTYFAEVTFTRTWARWRANLSYNRRDSQSTGVARTTLIDQITGKLAWIPGERWEVNWRAAVSQQESATSTLNSVTVGIPSPTGQGVPGLIGQLENIGLIERQFDNALDVRTYTGSMVVRFKLMRNTEVFSEASYRKQESDGTVFRQGLNNDNYRIALGFRYDFRPIHF